MTNRSTELSGSPISRRRLIESIGVSATFTTAGCLGDDTDNTDGNTNNANDDSDASEDTDANDDTDGNTDDGEGQTAITDVTVRSEDHTSENTVHSITIRYATNTVSEIDPPDSNARSATSNEKFLVVRSEVTVESDLNENIDVYGTAIGIEAAGIIYDGRSIRNLPELTQTVTPGTTYDAWIYYEIPEDVTEATLVATNPRDWFDYPVEITFEQDGSLSATIPE